MTALLQIYKRITFCGQPARVACDGMCHKAWGISHRPRVQLGGDEDDYAWLADGELGDAPQDPGTEEGGHAKPRLVRGPEDMNTWCVRECERCVISEPGRSEELLELRDFSRRVYNLSRIEPGDEERQAPPAGSGSE